MIDQEYINSLLELPKREAKDTFVEYAAGFGIELKKNLTIDAMIEKFKEDIQSLNDEPMPESEEGAMSVAELLQQEGTRIEVQGASLVHAPIGETVSVVDEPEAPPVVTIAPPQDETIESVETPVVVVETQPEAIQEQTMVHSEVSYLPGYRIMPLMGPSPGYIHIPYWVHDFIEANPDWKHKIQSQRTQDLIVLNSILYHICKHGSVKVRESRNSRFIDIR